MIHLAGHTIDTSLAQKIPARLAYRHTIVPIKQEGRVLFVATHNPSNIHAFDDLRLLLHCHVQPVICSEKEILKTLKKLYGVGAETVDTMVSTADALPHEQPTHNHDTHDDNDDTTIIKFVNQIIAEAFHDRATDVHIEPFEHDLFVRYRIDGILHKAPMPATIQRFQHAIISRIKIMAGMDIAEKRLPQDGSIRFKIAGEEIDLRVSTLPIMHGESVDIRILPRTQMLLGLEHLGLPENYLKIFETLITRPHGIILVTGPTGHGKTTTLYSCLSKINAIDKKIITVEEPIEYQLKGINQVSVHHKIGLTFANGLRAILRQDPDVIMVGEIRDHETAEIAIRSSLTGHLVFSTLHTNDAAGAITRLIDMGIEPYLVSSSIEAIMAQRLVRLVCPQCREAYTPEKSVLERLGFPSDYEGQMYKAGKGCEECRHTGYKGRTGIYELLVMDDDIRQRVLEKTTAGNIKKDALAKGMKTLRNDGWDKVIQGLTTMEEIVRVTQEEAM